MTPNAEKNIPIVSNDRSFCLKIEFSGEQCPRFGDRIHVIEINNVWTADLWIRPWDVA